MCQLGVGVHIIEQKLIQCLFQALENIFSALPSIPNRAIGTLHRFVKITHYFSIISIVLADFRRDNSRLKDVPAHNQKLNPEVVVGRIGTLGADPLFINFNLATRKRCSVIPALFLATFSRAGGICNPHVLQSLVLLCLQTKLRPKSTGNKKK